MTVCISKPAPSVFELSLPPNWRMIDFLSDLHLQASEPATYAAFANYLRDSPADGIFILGDLFEVWVGDDAAHADSFEGQCGQILKEAASRKALYFLRGNRDFLLGSAFLNETGVRDLPDPTAFTFAGARWLLSHGDALCLEDTEYQQFRAQVRSPTWQRDFLARPLAERQAMALAMRAASTGRQQEMAHHADVDPNAARAWLNSAEASTLIHGHTHRPAEHLLGSSADGLSLRRVVLSDWHLDNPATPRADILRLDANGLHRLHPTQACGLP